jgi:hypothetical protein
MKKLMLTVSLLMFVFFVTKAQDAVKAPANGTTPPQDAVKQVDNPNAPDIKFDTEVHDYGTIQKGADGNCTFTFKNTGKEPLILSNARGSCGCTVPTWSKDPVLPGKTGEIKVHYDTNRIGTFGKQVTVTSNAKTATVVLNIKGNVMEPPKEVTPDKPADKTAPVNK